MKVWAFSGTKWSFTSNQEWKAVPFKGLTHLCEQLKAESFTGIDELCVVAHGDLNGSIDLDPPLDTTTMKGQHGDLVRLRNFLNAEATIAFVACTAGGYEKGDELLTYLSTIWAGCLVVGYDVPLVVMGPVPGFEAVAPFTRGSRSDKWSINAKWSRNGSIIKAPLLEVLGFQELDPTFQKRCGSDACRGHTSNGDICAPYKRGKFPDWPVSRDELARLRKKRDEMSRHAVGPTGKDPHRAHDRGKRDHLDLRAPGHPSGAGFLVAPGSHGL